MSWTVEVSPKRGRASLQVEAVGFCRQMRRKPPELGGRDQRMRPKKLAASRSQEKHGVS